MLWYLGEKGDSEPLGVVPISVVSATSPTFLLQWRLPVESRSTRRCR